MLYTTPNKKISSIMGTSPDEIDMGQQGSDRVILIAVIFLMVFGVVAVYSAIAYFAESNQTSAFSLVTGHILKMAIAFSVLLIASKIDYHAVVKVSKVGLIVSWGFILLVMFTSSAVFGARRSFDFAGISFQPSSLAIVMLLIYISGLLAEKQDYIKDPKRAFSTVLFWVGITCLLIAFEDFSSAAILFATCFLLMFVARISALYLGGLVMAGLLVGALFIGTSPERQSRIDEYVNQITNINSSSFNVEEGYQAQQAHIAIAQGEMIGVGIGKSTQRDFLPAPYNDFIFAIIAEEYGLMGSAFIILLFTVIFFRGIAVVAKNAPDTVGTLLAVSCTLMISLYGFVNAAVASGLFPVTGLPMPFVSYGGSSMVFAGLMVGILLNISKHSTQKESVFYA